MYVVLAVGALERLDRDDWPLFVLALAALSVAAFVATLWMLRRYVDGAESKHSPSKKAMRWAAVASSVGSLTGVALFHSTSRGVASNAFFAVVTAAVVALAFWAGGRRRQADSSPPE